MPLMTHSSPSRTSRRLEVHHVGAVVRLGVETLGSLRVESVVSVTGEVVARTPDTVNPKIPTGTVEVNVTPSRSSRGRRPALPGRAGHRGARGPAAALPVPRPAQRPGHRAVPQRARLTQAGPHPPDRVVASSRSRRHPTATRPRGHGISWCRAGCIRGELYHSPGAAAVQAATHGGRSRALLPDRACFRDEASRADRSPGEFYQIDLEMALPPRTTSSARWSTSSSSSSRELTAKRAEAPFPRLTFADVVARYGTDKPDLRFDLTIAELTELLGGPPSSPCSGCRAAKGHAIRAFR